MTGIEAVAPSGVAAILLPCGCPAVEVRDTGLHQDGCPRGDLNIVHGPGYPPPFRPNTGGRAAAGFTGKAPGDCATRAIAIAAERPYREVYDLIAEYGKAERRTKRRRAQSHPRTGTHRATTDKVIRDYGGVWTPTMAVGSGTLIHVRADELPYTGRHVLRLSKHFAAWIEGELWDTHDCSREGTRAVYGYWTFA